MLKLELMSEVDNMVFDNYMLELSHTEGLALVWFLSYYLNYK